MNAIELLKQDHQQAAAMMQQLAAADEGGQGKDPQHTEIFNDLKQALTLHTRMEEQVFYPAMEEFDEASHLIGEAYREHDQVDTLLEHHVEEEERDIFPLAQQLCGQQRLEEMGREMEQMKQGQSVAATNRRR
jgi:hemerythrin superfamily protein